MSGGFWGGRFFGCRLFGCPRLQRYGLVGLELGSSWLGNGFTGWGLFRRRLAGSSHARGRSFRSPGAVAQHHRPLGIGEIGWLSPMGIGNLGRLLNVDDQVFPGGCEPLVGLGFRPTLHQGFDNASDRHLLAAAIEDFLWSWATKASALSLSWILT